MTLLNEATQHDILRGTDPTSYANGFHEGHRDGFKEGFDRGREVGRLEAEQALAARDAVLADLQCILEKGRRAKVAQEGLAALEVAPDSVLAARDAATALATSQFVRNFRADMSTEDGYTPTFVEGYDAATREAADALAAAAGATGAAS